MKKAALEISLNFIVTTILGIVIFFGIAVLNRNVFVETLEMQDQLDAQTERELMDVFQVSSEDFIVPFRTEEGTPGDSVYFPVGLRNAFNHSDCNEMNISVSPGNEEMGESITPDMDIDGCTGYGFPVGYTRDEWEVICSEDVDFDTGEDIYDWIFASDNKYGPYEISQGNVDTFPIVFTIPDENIPDGIYFFTLSVENNHDHCYVDVYNDVTVYILID